MTTKAAVPSNHSPTNRLTRADVKWIALMSLVLWVAPHPSGADTAEIRIGSSEPIRPPYASALPPRPWEGDSSASILGRAPWRSPIENVRERRLRVREALGEMVAVPDPTRREAALQSAALFVAAQDWEAARFAYLRAIRQGANGIDVFRGLGRAALASRDTVLAEAAQLGALDHLSSVDDPIQFVELRAKIHRDLVLIYQLDGRRRDAALALGHVDGLSPTDRSTASWLDRQRYVSMALPLSGLADPAIDWPESGFDSAGPLTRWGRSVRELLPAPVLAQWQATRGWVQADERRRTVLLAAFGTIGFLVLTRIFRQRGDLIVTVQYPDELRGVFRVRVSSPRLRPRGLSEDWRAQVRKGGASTRYERHFVNRETQLTRLGVRRYAVWVEGVLLDPETEEVLGEFRDRKIVRVRNRRTVRLEFDASPEACPVDVEVFWHDAPAADVAVRAVGQPDAVPRSQGRGVRLGLPPGRHRLVVGAGDRVVEQAIDVASYRPTPVRMDLAGAEVVFKGCPPAVGPYLEGKIETVARALERDGQSVLAYRLLAREQVEGGNLDRAADFFESAGDTLEAARIRSETGDFIRSARLYEQAEQDREAARMWRQAGRLVEAGQAFERAEDLEAAIECYREARAIDSWISVLERRGRTFEAAQLALDADQRPRAIRLMQAISPDDAHFTEASWLLVGAFERESHFDLAAQKLEQHIASHPARGAPADRYAKLAELYEAAGHLERALEVLEDLRIREPTYPHIASRMESLRKQRSADRFVQSAVSPVLTGADAPTALIADARYEMLEEIGRGGMGVVYKARDRRLDRIVALKRLPEDLRRHHPRAVQLFLREAQAAARLNHPNIVTVHDTGQEEGHFFITMELLDGAPFNRILRQRGRLSTEHVIRIGTAVASALEYAHAQGIVHRDIKTANLFLTTEKTVKVMDFGLAKMFEEVRAGTTVISGTPFYMSPEQILGGAVDQRTDLYSLGVTLYELATGEVPFAKGDIAYHHRHTPAPDPRTLRADLPDSLATLLLRLLDKEPSHRLSSSAQLIEALRQVERDGHDAGGSSSPVI
ncbi:MAG: hypothetical protein CBC48_00250 [bacterium TMED88]|nr:hypothetical protein [Deltaproteobacteria bacterium]OUV37615.1 MAG: hypothetical protein CBC48_00250 [bacterium TMED88]